MSELTEDQTMIVDAARAFAVEKLRPNAARWENEGLDRAVLRELAELGFAGIYVKEDVGGSGLTRLDAALIFEELSRGCVATEACQATTEATTTCPLPSASSKRRAC